VSKKKKTKKKKRSGLEMASDVVVGYSEAVEIKGQNVESGDIKLEEIVNENRISYVHDHHTEV
jgi:hypothetical protein